jgi:hypothetical protein
MTTHFLVTFASGKGKCDDIGTVAKLLYGIMRKATQIVSEEYNGMIGTQPVLGVLQ